MGGHEVINSLLLAVDADVVVHFSDIFVQFCC